MIRTFPGDVQIVTNSCQQKEGKQTNKQRNKQTNKTSFQTSSWVHNKRDKLKLESRWCVTSC